jgi:uncharacterized protein YjcR
MQQLTLTDISPDDSAAADASGASDEPKYRDEEWLRGKYVEDGWSTYDIAEECGCARTTVCKWLNRHGIKTRGRKQTPDERLADEEWLREQYVEKERPQANIAEECASSLSTVSKWLNRHGIKTRGRKQTPDERLADEEWLREQYVEKEWPQADIAEECGCSSSTVRNWLNRHGIETRDAAFTGPENPNWNGGETPYGPGWNASKRAEVRERDGYTCQDPSCSVTQAEHRNQYDEKLHVHHLIKARDIDDPEERNAMGNLITLCRDCHSDWEQVSEMGIRPEIISETAD